MAAYLMERDVRTGVPHAIGNIQADVGRVELIGIA
jgi:hypothetical protein